METTLQLTTELESGTTINTRSSPKLLRRLRRRLVSKGSSSITTEEIEAKLKDADLRRQHFYKLLASKARSKPRSLASSSLQEEDLGQQIKAKLNAAEQKRLSILAKVQKRLAKSDELRKAAKTGAETHFEKVRAELGVRVASRVQQAEVNRMLLLKAHRQQRAAKRERAAQLLMQRLIQESKYKECVKAAIAQKRAAAEKKRLDLLEAEKSRARARALRVRWIVNSVYSRRENERRRLKNQLEDRLQRAKKLKVEYLRQKGILHNSRCESSELMVKQGELLSRKLAKCWRSFVNLRGTTFALAKAYLALDINKKSVKFMPFERLAVQIESGATIHTLNILLDRLESGITLQQHANDTGDLSGLENIDQLLKRVVSPSPKSNSANASISRGLKKKRTKREVPQSHPKLARYQVRVILCAYMILGHPEVVFSRKGECEIALADSAKRFIREFELMIGIILHGPTQYPQEETTSSSPTRRTFRYQRKVFDKAWCSYLHHFVLWKVKDGKSLEQDLVQAACQMELSMMQTCNVTAAGDYGGLTPDMKAIQEQVIKDQEFLREKVLNLSGTCGLQHMECALSDMRSIYIEARSAGSSSGFPLAHMSSSSSPCFSDGSAANNSSERNDLAEGHDNSGYEVCSVFNGDNSSSGNEVESATSSCTTNGHLSSQAVSYGNEVLVNEIVHEHRHGFAGDLDFSNKYQDNIKDKVKETMEKAFWDGIMESMEQDEPNYSWVLRVIEEVRDELSEMSPSGWRQEILDSIDIDILSQVLKSGTLDMVYFGRILEFALVTLQKLSAPANGDEMKTTHQMLLNELGEISQAGDKVGTSSAHLLMKGLRFLLQQIQILKHEISKAHMRMLEPLVKGPAGLDYLNKAFADRYGTPTDAPASLSLTMRWLSTLKIVSTQEWDEYLDSLSALEMSNVGHSQGLSRTTLRTGGSIIQMSPTIGASTAVYAGTEQPECKGERIDLLLRLGLLKLVSEVEGLMVENLPETLKLNLSRLRSVQSQLQKLIVICTSVLVLRQALPSESLVTTPVNMENVASQCTKQLFELLDNVDDVGVSEIVETMSGFSVEFDSEKLRARKELMANMLAKSLRAGDSVFTRVSRSVYLAARAIVLGGSGIEGKELAETMLKRVGAALLSEKLVEAVEVLVLVATISGSVHKAWYEQVLKNI